MTAEQRGKFIVFEGNDGAGKSTQARRLAEYLKEQGLDVILTRQPGGIPETELFRSLALDDRFREDGTTQLLFFAADRREHLKRQIVPALGRGTIVICDRFSLSTIVYQHYDRGISFEDVRYIDRVARSNIGGIKEVQPDLVIVIDASPEVTMRRKSGEQESHFDRDGLEKQKRRREAYLTLAKRYGWRVVNAEQEKDKVFRDVVKILDEEGVLSK